MAASNHEVKLNSKNMGLINRQLQLQLSELFRTLTQASRSLLLLEGWEIEERTPFTRSTYETWFGPFSLKVYPYDSKRLRWTKKPLTSVQGMNPLQTWAKNFQLSASFKISFKTLWEKNNDKPLKQFLSSHDYEVILLIVTAAQLNLAEFCPSFKEKL